MRDFPLRRLRLLRPDEAKREGEYVLYWMTAFRRLHSNFALQRAADWAEELGKPLLIFEALRVDYPWASTRLHRFVVEGMAEHAHALQGGPVAYYPYLEAQPGAGRGLLAALAEKACVVVSDDFPSFFLPQMWPAAQAKLHCRFELVDSNGLLPMRAAERAYERAYDFRRFLQKALPEHLRVFPAAQPLQERSLRQAGALPAEIVKRWPPLDSASLIAGKVDLDSLPLDTNVAPAEEHGGSSEAQKRLRHFLRAGLSRYGQDRNHPDEDASSGLSPWLHFGHLSAHEVFQALADWEEWTPEKLVAKAQGKREGWWQMSEGAESFLDELLTWRELAFNMCALRPDDYARYDSLPAWAQRTLDNHRGDPRPKRYSLAQLEAAETHDQIWNAAQRQIVREGRMHNYLRMLWGKKVLEWSASPEEALETLIELNNKYGLDGRNPNSYAGIFWIFGRYDRPWAPERPIFGTIRYMSSDNTLRKLRMRDYLHRFRA